MHLSPVWFLLLLGLVAQAAFFLRTLSPTLKGKPDSPEPPRPKDTPLPWWLSALAGGVCVLLFALLRRDIVLLVGQCFLLALYLRHMPRGGRAPRPVPRDEG